MKQVWMRAVNPPKGFRFTLSDGTVVRPVRGNLYSVTENHQKTLEARGFVTDDLGLDEADTNVRSSTETDAPKWDTGEEGSNPCPSC